MKNYGFDGLLTIGTGKIDFLSGFDDKNHPAFPSDCPKDFACVFFDSRDSEREGKFHISVCECSSLREAVKLLKSLLSDYQLDFYAGCRYACTSFGSSKIIRSVRYFRDGFDFESV